MEIKIKNIILFNTLFLLILHCFPKCFLFKQNRFSIKKLSILVCINFWIGFSLFSPWSHFKKHYLLKKNQKVGWKITNYLHFDKINLKWFSYCEYFVKWQISNDWYQLHVAICILYNFWKNAHQKKSQPIIPLKSA